MTFEDFIMEIVDDESVFDHPDEDLFELGYLDSMAFVELIVSLDSNFGISLSPADMKREDYNTLNKIRNFIEKEQK